MLKRVLSIIFSCMLLLSMMTVIVTADGEQSVPTDATVAEDEMTDIFDEFYESDIPSQALITLPSIDAEGKNSNIDVIATEAQEPIYLLTNEAGQAVYTDATADNYHIKFEFPLDGVPTLTLKNAKLINGQGNGLTIGRRDSAEGADILYFDFVINVETDSVISGTYNAPGQPGSYSGIFCKHAGMLTITGPGKLTLTSEGMYPLYMDGYDLLIQNANVSVASLITMSKGIRPAIWVKNADISIENSTVEVTANSGAAIWISDSVSGISDYYGDSFDITITGGSHVKATNLNTELATIGCSGSLTINESCVEVFAKNRCFATEPVLTNAGAVAGADSASAVEYKEEMELNYQYFLSFFMIDVPVEPVIPPEQETEGQPEDETVTPPEQESETQPIPGTEPETGPTGETTGETIGETTGETIGETTPESTPEATEPSDFVTTPTTIPDTAPDTVPEFTEDISDVTQQDNRGHIAIYVVGGVLLVAALLGAAWFFLAKKRSK